jgi:hypothetical protein
MRIARQGSAAVRAVCSFRENVVNSINRACAAIAIACAATATAADAAVFDINRTIGAGSVVGTVTTDGTTGVLSTGNITAWSLTLDDGVSSFLLTDGNGEVLVLGSALSATATELLFDFAQFGVALFQNPSIGSSVNYWCVEGPSSGCTFFGIANGAAEVVATLAGDVGVVQSGQVVIGTTDAVGVPAPAAMALFGLGLLGLAAARRRD